MPAGGAEVISVMYDRFNRGEYADATEMLHEDVVLHQWEAVPDSDTYVGRDEFVRGLTRWISGFEPGFRFVIEQIAETDTHVWTRVRLSGRGRESGIDLDQTVFQVWEVRDGKGYRLRIYSSEEEAWEAARGPSVR